MSSRVQQTSVEITHPNRDKPVVRATRAAVIVLLLISVALLLIVSIGGQEALDTSVLPIQYFFVLTYLLIAYLAVRWRRGALPVGSALAVLLAVFALVGGSYWFNRDYGYFSASTLNPTLLGVLTFAIIPVQILLIVFAMRGFSQGWNVELERPVRASRAPGGAAPGPSAA
jgi:drug/metabolite transporter (DMT)-like permease